MTSVAPLLRVIRFRYLRLLPALLALVTACSRPSSSTPAIQLANPDAPAAYVGVTGLSGDTLDALDDSSITPEQWASILKVSVTEDAPGMLGTYAVESDELRFTPAFAFDQGRQYHVVFDPSKVPGAAAGGTPLMAMVGRAASTAVPSTVVTQIYPSGDSVPENLLRMYVEFSAPMGRKSGIEYLKVFNEAGQEIPGAVLPLDYEFWSPDHKRFTIFFDPGRVKEGILPNREMGRPLTYGGAMTLVVSREWKDENGQPLKEEYRRTFKVTAADKQPLDPSTWKVQAPAAGSRDAVVVTFNEALDRGLLMRAVGIRRNGQQVNGEITIDQGETRWRFTPSDPWQGGAHDVLVLSTLEDLAGNEIGRAFEVDNFDTVDKTPEPQTTMLPFTVR